MLQGRSDVEGRPVDGQAQSGRPRREGGRRPLTVRFFPHVSVFGSPLGLGKVLRPRRPPISGSLLLLSVAAQFLDRYIYRSVACELDYVPDRVAAGHHTTTVYV